RHEDAEDDAEDEGGDPGAPEHRGLSRPGGGSVRWSPGPGRASGRRQRVQSPEDRGGARFVMAPHLGVVRLEEVTRLPVCLELTDGTEGGDLLGLEGDPLVIAAWIERVTPSAQEGPRDVGQRAEPEEGEGERGGERGGHRSAPGG